MTVWLLCAHTLMTSIYFILEDPTRKKTSVMYLIFMFRLMFNFRIFISWKATSPHLSNSRLETCTNEIRVFGGQHQTEIKAYLHFRASLLQMSQLQVRILIYQFIPLNSLRNSISYGFCVFNRVASWIKVKALILVLSSSKISHQVILVSHSN